MKKKSGIILALDVDSKKEALRIAGEVSDLVDAIKVGYPLILPTGIRFLRELKKFGNPIIADFKVADIPIISQKICQLAQNNGADYVIVHGFVGEDVIKACSEVAEIFVVAEMSHPGSKDFLTTGAERIAEIARRYAYGIVAPATRPERIKILRKTVGDLIIISPGIKAQGAKVGDAIRSGADFEIIGRGIYQASDPREATEEFSKIIGTICI